MSQFLSALIAIMVKTRSNKVYTDGLGELQKALITVLVAIHSQNVMFETRPQVVRTRLPIIEKPRFFLKKEKAYDVE
jgi:hypothetical protein